MTYAIRMTYSGQCPPVVGWVLDGTKAATYPTPEDAERAMNKLRRDKRYSWHYTSVEVVEYKEGRK